MRDRASRRFACDFRVREPALPGRVARVFIGPGTALFAPSAVREGVGVGSEQLAS